MFEILMLISEKYQQTTKKNNCFRQKSVHLHLPKTNVTFDTAVVMTVRAGQNFKWSKI